MPENPLKPKLDRIRQQPTFDANGNIKQTYVVTFNVGPHGPFTVQIPETEFDAAHVTAAMDRVSKQISQIATGA